MVKVRRPLSERDVCDESGVRYNPMDLRLESFLKGSTHMSEAMLLLFDRDLKEYDVPDGRTCSTIEARHACRRIHICLAGRRVGWRLGEGGSPLQSPRRIPTWRGWPSLIGAVASADLTGDGLSSPVRRQGAGAAALWVSLLVEHVCSQEIRWRISMWNAGSSTCMPEVVVLFRDDGLCFSDGRGLALACRRRKPVTAAT